MQSQLIRHIEQETRNIARVKQWRGRYFMATVVVVGSWYNSLYNKSGGQGCMLKGGSDG